MSDYDHNCPIEEVNQLVEQTELVSLRGTLLDVIYKHAPGSEIFLFEHGLSTYNTDNQQPNFLPRLKGYRGKNA